MVSPSDAVYFCISLKDEKGRDTLIAADCIYLYFFIYLSQAGDAAVIDFAA